MAEVYCCKKLINGEIKKYMSHKPCREIGAVKCSDPDPQPGTPGAGGDQDVMYVPADQQCPEGYNDAGVIDEEKREARRDCRQEYRDCLSDARIRGNDAGAIQRCREELSRCFQDIQAGGTKLRKCVKTGGGGEEPTDGTTPCQGGYKLGDDFSGGAGVGMAYWHDPNGVIPDNTVMRSHEHEGHMVWYPEKKQFFKVEDLQNYYQKGGDFPQGYNSTCKKGFVRQVINGETWCCPETGGGGGGGSDLGTFSWSGGTQGLLDRLLSEANALLDRPRGTTEAERQAIINYATRGVEQKERGDIQAVRQALARQGLLGSGFELAEEEKIRRGTQENVAEIEQAAMIDELDRRFQEMTGGISLANMLLGQAMTGEQLVETMNAARRAEGQDALGLMLQYLSILMGSQNNAYTGAILNQLLSGYM